MRIIRLVLVAVAMMVPLAPITIDSSGIANCVAHASDAKAGKGL